MKPRRKVSRQFSTAELVATINRIRTEPGALSRRLCEAAVGIARKGIKNPFLTYSSDDGAPQKSARYIDVATVCLMRLDQRELDLTGEFIRLEDWIATRDKLPCSSRLVEDDFRFGDTERIFEKYFTAQSEAFGSMVWFASELVYHGVPLYAHGAADPLPFNHEDYSYLTRLGAERAASQTGTYPDWAKKYSVRRDHLEIHNDLFDWVSRDASDRTISALRTEFRKRINFPVSNSGKTPEELDAEYEALRRQKQELDAKSLDQIHKFIARSPKTFARIICQATLGQKGEGELVDHYAEIMGRDTPAGKRPYYAELAEICLARLQLEGQKETPESDAPDVPLGEIQPGDGEFVSLKDWVSRHISLPRPRYHGHYTSSDPVNMASTFFEGVEEDFSFTLYWACQLVYHGIPLYERESDDSMIPFTHEDYIYLRMCGRHGGGVERYSRLPFWAKKYFVKREHLVKHRRYFSQHDELTPEEVDEVRETFRWRMGFGDKSAGSDAEIMPGAPLSKRLQTKLFKVVEQIMSGQCREFFELKGADETWPKQEPVVRWLQNTFELSEAEAKAVDMITRPDEIRARGKKGNASRR